MGAHGGDSAAESKRRVDVERSTNINVTAAYLHILGDLLLSVGVVISSVVIYVWPTEKYPWSKYFDPACTLIFSIIICYTCKDVLSNGIFILMEGTPTTIDTPSMIKEIEAIEHVQTIHDFHCWSLSRGKYSMSCHIVVDEKPMEILEKATKVVNDYGIDHCTIQMEDKNCGHACEEDEEKEKEKEKAHGHGHGHGHDHGHGHGHGHGHAH